MGYVSAYRNQYHASDGRRESVIKKLKILFWNFKFLLGVKTYKSRK